MQLGGPGPRIVFRDRTLYECFSNRFRSSSTETTDLNSRSAALPNAFDAAVAHYARDLYQACIGWRGVDLVEIGLDIRAAPRQLKEDFCRIHSGTWIGAIMLRSM